MNTPAETDDFSDLDEIIAEAEEKRASAKTLTAKQKRLQRGGISEDEKFAILAEIRTLEDKYVWQTTGAIALFNIQHCLSCGHTHRFFQGWMTAQQHKRDPNCRRLVRGKPTEPLAERIEEHDHGSVEMCGDCAEACLAINLYLRTEHKNGRPLDGQVGGAGGGIQSPIEPGVSHE